MKKILVTGGAGFIGSHLAEKLMKTNEFIIVLDNFDPYYNPKIKKKNLEKVRTYKNFVLINGDIRKGALIQKLITKYNPQFIIHLAAKVGVRNSLIHPKEYADVNILGTLNLLESIKNYKLQNFIFASSSSVYGANKKIPFSENDPVDSQLSVYAVTKRAAELLCHQYSNRYHIPISILRFFTVYGPRQRPDLVIRKFVDRILQNKFIEIYGDGNSKRDFVYVEDVIEGIIKLLAFSSPFEIFNIGNSSPVSINKIINLLERLLHKKSKKRFLPFRNEDMKLTHANIDKANNLLGWKPKIDFKTGLERTIKEIYH